MTLVFSILYNMRITRTSKEIVDIVNETIGMDVCHADGDDAIKIDANNDAEGNEICFHDYIFCSFIAFSIDSFYHYVNQQGMMDERPDLTLNSYPVNDDETYNDKCLNRDGEHDDFCDFTVNADDIGVWTFDEETFINVLEGLKIAFKVKAAQQIVILDDDEEFAV